MAEQLLSAVSGITETETTITITKASLAYGSYTPRDAMTADEFTIAILEKMGGILTETNREANADQSVVITKPSKENVALDGFTNANGQRFFTLPYTAEVYKLADDSLFTINPGEF